MPKAPVDGSIPWKLIWWFAWLLRPFLCKLQVEGLENVPLSGGFLLASNHFAGLDTVVKGFTCPRQIHYMAKKELFEVNAFSAWFFPTFGVFPIERGRLDLHALQEAVALVSTGHVVGIYPEGTRSRTGALGRGKTGTARIALDTGVPVVPVMSLGGQHLFSGILKWGRPTITVKFGKPLHLQGDAHKSADARRETSRIMYAIAELLPPDRRGVYADIPEDTRGETSITHAETDSTDALQPESNMNMAKDIAD